MLWSNTVARRAHARAAVTTSKAKRFGHFVRAAALNDYNAISFCERHGIALQKAHATSPAEVGGFLVPDEFEAELIALRNEYGVIRRAARVVPMGRDSIIIPRRTGGLTAYAVGEAQAITESQASWSQVRLTANKWGTLTITSSELDEDSPNFGLAIADEIAYALAMAEDTAGFAGDGSGAYHGITGLLTTFEAGGLAGAVPAAPGHDTFSSLDAADIVSLMAALPDHALPGAAWIASARAFALVFARLAASFGGLVAERAGGRNLLYFAGFPVLLSAAMPATTSTLSGKAMLLFGDLSQAMSFGDRRGITITRSETVAFAEDQIAIKATERFDINIHDIGDASTAGPVVALMGAQ